MEAMLGNPLTRAPASWGVIRNIRNYLTAIVLYFPWSWRSMVARVVSVVVFMSKHPIVLAAEDEESDVFLLGMAFKKAGVPNALTIVRDGQEAIDYLNGDVPYHDRSRYPLPGLLLLDLNMPRMNGFDVLQWLALHPALNNLPAVVLSSSAQDSDVEKARTLGAVDYRVKPTGMDNLIQLIQEIVPRWLESSPAAGSPRHACSSSVRSAPTI
jgi:CheY-like chemotaxis protein